MSEARFTQKTSLILTFRTAVSVLAALLLLELMGFYFSDQSFLKAISSIRDVQILSNAVGELKQITDSLTIVLRRPEQGPQARREKLQVYSGIYRQALSTLLAASSQAGGDLDSARTFEDVKRTLLDLNEAVTRYALDFAVNSRERELLIALQLNSEAAEALDQLKIALASRADRGFQNAYRARYRPLVESTFLAFLLIVATLGLGMHLIRRLQTAIQSLIGATRAAARGNMEVLAPILTHDEIGTLANSFNEMATALRNRDEFLSIASHELKTPITSLVLRLQIFVREVNAGAKPTILEAGAAAAEREARRLAQLVDGLLDLTRIRLGQLGLNVEPIDLSALVATVIQRFSLESSEKGIEIQLNILGPRRGPILGLWDPVRIDQVVSNLISNAIKYGNGKPISVSVENDFSRQLARVNVTDQGPGIPEDMRERVFERYQRLNQASTKRISGFGLGLYVCRQIVRGHGGTIRVENRVGGGSRFVVELPWKNVPSSAAA